MVSDPPAGAAASNGPDLTAAMLAEGEQLQCDLLYSEKAHFAAAERLSSAHLRIGITATLSSGAAAASVIADVPVLAGILALAAALASGLLTFLKPDHQAANHLAIGRQLDALRVELRQVLRFDVSAKPQAEVRDALRSTAERKAEIDNSAPSTTERDFEAASLKIKRGDFDV